MRIVLLFLLNIWAFSSVVLAQDIHVFGAQTCQGFLRRDDDRLALSWMTGFWSGLNMGATVWHKPADTGKTIQATDIFARVGAVCQKEPSLPLAMGVAKAWAQTQAAGQ